MKKVENIKTITKLRKYSSLAILLNMALFASTQATGQNNTGKLATTHLDHIVATVNGSPILASDLAQAVTVAKQSLASTDTMYPDSTLSNMALDGLITRATQLAIIRQSGGKLLVSDEILENALLRIAKKQGFDTVVSFKAYLDGQDDRIFKQVKQNLQEQLTIKNLHQQKLAERVKISQQDIDYFLQSPESEQVFEYDYRTLHFRITTTDSTPFNKEQMLTAGKWAMQLRESLKLNKSETEILAEFNTNDQGLVIQGGDLGFYEKAKLPDFLQDSIVKLKTGGATDPIVHKDGVHIVKLLEKRIKEVSTVKQWQVRHVLIKPSAVKNLAEAEQNITDLYNRVISKQQSFSEIASTYSDDPGSAKKGGSLDWVMVGQMVPAFEKTMIAMPKGIVSKPFQSKFGWHILQVDDIREKDMSKEYKQMRARQVLNKRFSEEAMEDWMQELRSDSHIEIFDNKYKL